jgi:hypothetical protein
MLDILTIHDRNNNQSPVNEDGVGQMEGDPRAHGVVVLHIANLGGCVALR